MYQFDSRVRYSEVDSQGMLTWRAMTDYFQDCSLFHSHEHHIAVDYLKENHIAWVLSSWQICLNRMPVLAEKITIQTWAYDLKGFYGLRNFSMNDAVGNRLAYANSVWVLMDTVTGKPARIPQEMIDRYGIDEQLPMDCCSRKLKIPKDYVAKEQFVVPSFFIDTNQHMNNSCYIQVAMQYLPESFVVGEVRVEYKKAAFQGDIMVPRVTMGENMVTVTLCSEDGAPYAVSEFLKKKE